MKATLYYDASLKSIVTTQNSEQLIIEYQGKQISLPADPLNAHYHEKRLKGQQNSQTQIGLVRLVQRKTAPNHTLSFYRFDLYPDQTLRRAFDLDDYEYLRNSTHNLNCIGWRNQKNPDGFLSPKGIIPGANGHFISDNTENYTVPIPFEFIELSSKLKVSPVALLRTFIADVCRLRNNSELPRADGFTSRGNEAEKRAREYLRNSWKLKKDFF